MIILICYQHVCAGQHELTKDPGLRRTVRQYVMTHLSPTIESSGHTSMPDLIMNFLIEIPFP